jgi:hypothetical protein
MLVTLQSESETAAAVTRSAVSLVLTSQVVSMSLVPMKELPQRPHQSLSLKSSAAVEGTADGASAS